VAFDALIVLMLGCLAGALLIDDQRTRLAVFGAGILIGAILVWLRLSGGS
jgi:hypothetical protein